MISSVTFKGGKGMHSDICMSKMLHWLLFPPDAQKPGLILLLLNEDYGIV